ncbi:PliI family lysozyme inhibitor of I-type lysozyme [Chryseobacterium sp. MDT2-18]|uniref:PliI family lysozyme inhibitor of I-type lysozyme n=1 Tax=Chryseobacterium sp. MDT2-18 TaxID=1259136 RepID=UPI00278B278E|nr:PliI family lysozyme inhibitor of I-type lysozyme [Chryseobacterium sp. MDT2-18]MDQ0477294.1 hypothetical protein [Chryseobacterium sp. MDT2-18]
MNIFKKSTLIAVIVSTVLSCKNNSEKTETDIKTAEQSIYTDDSGKSVSGLVGDYVSSSYNRRNEGYDWVAVSVTQLANNSIHISVRSRADKKKPTCTFDADASEIDENVYRATVNGKNILFTFKNNTVTIASEKPEDGGLLNYYCSGGGSLGGVYTKIGDPIDKKQTDPRIFTKTLSLQNIGFDVSTAGKGSIQELTIQPSGLKVDNNKITIDIDGSVTNAEIEDLNSDGFPEILIYTMSAGSGSYGNVIGYSVNNGKSMSQIYFPPIADNIKANKGYMGHDEFAVVETTLVQRFKTFTTGDTNSSPTGNIRQIQYKLKDGEATRKFVIDKITEYPGK